MTAFLVFLSLALQGPNTSTLRGIVRDTDARTIAGASVRVEGSSGGPITTGPDGRFELVSLAPGRYRLVIDAPGFATAQKDVVVPSPDDVSVALEPARVSEQVVVTASRGESRVPDTAAPVSLLTAGDIERAPSPVLDDVLRTTPGFSLFRRTSSRTANPTTQGATLRGLAASGASRALVLADGVPLNDPFGGWVYWNRVPIAAIDRVEVVRGGASDLYGADAIAGVIQVLTVKPATTSARLFVDGDTNTTGRMSGLAAWRRAGSFAIASAEGSGSKGAYVISESDRGPIDTRADSDYATGFLRAGQEWASGWHATGTLQAYGESRQNGTVLQTNDTSTRRATMSIAGPVGRGLWELSGDVGDQRYHQSFSAIGAGRATETLTSRQTVPSSSYGIGTTWRRLFGGTDVLLGADLREVGASNREVSYQPNGQVRARTDLRGFDRTAGAFVQVRTNAGARTTIVAGARGDLWEPVRGDITNGVISPRASVSVRLAGPFVLRGAASSSFRAPTINERIRPFRAGNVLTLANPDLDVEELSVVEGSVLADGQHGTARVTVFSGWLDNAVTNVTLETTPTLITRQRQNAGGVRANGVESEGEWRPHGALSLAGSLAWTQSRFADTAGLTGNDVPQVPRWQGAVLARWLAPRRLVVQGQLRWFSDQFEDDRNTLVLRGAALADLSASAPLGRGTAWIVSVENLFDTEYDTGRTPTRTIGTPRTARVGVRVGF